jgi:hypothetical protein
MYPDTFPSPDTWLHTFESFLVRNTFSSIALLSSFLWMCKCSQENSFYISKIDLCRNWCGLKWELKCGESKIKEKKGSCRNKARLKEGNSGKGRPILLRNPSLWWRWYIPIYIPFLINSYAIVKLDLHSVLVVRAPNVEYCKNMTSSKKQRMNIHIL